MLDGWTAGVSEYLRSVCAQMSVKQLSELMRCPELSTMGRVYVEAVHDNKRDVELSLWEDECRNESVREVIRAQRDKLSAKHREREAQFLTAWPASEPVNRGDHRLWPHQED